MGPITQSQSVTAVTQHIKSLLDGDPYLGDLWITGEIGDFTRASSGHCYFTLRDEQSELRCVMWRTQASKLRWRPRPGDAIDAHGYVSVYERGGAYQFYTDALLKGGIGARWQEFEALKARLDAEGLFDSARKRPIPPWPKRIGVVTSPTGAALQDILRVLSQRYPLVEVVLAETVVQGERAPTSIVRALEALHDVDVDVVLVARGGGSLEDLWAFNTEPVARAIVASPTPVITGVGHETDFTIADFSADLRAPTPSAAAAYAVPDGDEIRASMLKRVDALTEGIGRALDTRRGAVVAIVARFERLDPRREIAARRQHVDTLLRRGQRALSGNLGLRKSRLQGWWGRLQALDPREVLGRGYALVEDDSTGDRIPSVARLAPHQAIRLVFRDGSAGAQVTRVGPDGVGAESNPSTHD